MTKHLVAGAALTAAALTLTLASCGIPAGEESADQPSQAATPAAPPTPTADPTPELPVADEHSQVIDGVLYQGTPRAPVRIGTDIPGQPPTAEAGFVADETWKDYAQQADKYVVSMFPAYSDNVGGTSGGHFVGWLWKVFGLSQHGSFRELDSSGYSAGNYLPSREAVLACPYTVDGRVLDRAEYILAPIDDRYADVP